MSASFHAKIFRFAWRKLTGTISYLSSSPAPITAVLDRSPSCSCMAFMLTPRGGLIWSDFLVMISIPDCDRSWATVSISLVRTRLLVAHCIAFWSQSKVFFSGHLNWKLYILFQYTKLYTPSVLNYKSFQESWRVNPSQNLTKIIETNIKVYDIK